MSSMAMLVLAAIARHDARALTALVQRPVLDAAVNVFLTSVPFLALAAYAHRSSLVSLTRAGWVVLRAGIGCEGGDDACGGLAVYGPAGWPLLFAGRSAGKGTAVLFAGAVLSQPGSRTQYASRNRICVRMLTFVYACGGMSSKVHRLPRPWGRRACTNRFYCSCGLPRAFTNCPHWD